jgi:predicted amidophosphoribosyltransferase
MLKINYMSMQKINNVCSFCNSKIPQGESICKNCIKLYGITIGNYENDGCGCNK